MKLFYSPGACSLSPHIALREAGLPFELERVDLKTHKTAAGLDYYGINPKGYVPALRLDDGALLTEGPAIVQYVADQRPDSKLAPPHGTLERYRLMEWLNFIGTELHKAFSPLFYPSTPEEVKAASWDRIDKRLELVAKHLEGRDYLLGGHFTVADGYLFVMLRWYRGMGKARGKELARWPVLSRYFERLLARPAVQAALEAEGLARH